MYPPNHHPPTRNSMSAISQLLLIRFLPKVKCIWQHLSRQKLSCCIFFVATIVLLHLTLKLLTWFGFTGRFLGLTFAGNNGQGYFGSGNICQGNSCPVFFWTWNFSSTHIFGSNFFCLNYLVIFLDPNICFGINIFDTKFILPNHVPTTKTM